MATFDVRNGETPRIDMIVFEDDVFDAAQYLEQWESFVHIYDSADQFVTLQNKEHAQNLIKALNKAIELGWLK